VLVNGVFTQGAHIGGGIDILERFVETLKRGKRRI